MLAPWDVRILATDYYADQPCPPELERLLPADHLDALLAQSDVIILTLPLNAETEGIFDADRFARCKPGAYLINVARGSVVRESALVQALDSGRLAGAGLDVTEVEPLAPESLLWERDNVIITPHVGAQSSRRVDDTTNLVCLNLKRFLSGTPVYNRVEKQLGFPHPSVVYRPSVEFRGQDEQ